MNLYYQMLEELKLILSDRGFTEQQLNSARPPGTLFIELEERLSKCLSVMVFESDPTEFSLSINAAYNGNRDKVRFEFLILFNPVGLLRITKLRAWYRDHYMEMTIKVNQDLPHADIAFEAIKRSGVKASLFRRVFNAIARIRK